jgi:hypothetical protein
VFSHTSLHPQAASRLFVSVCDFVSVSVLLEEELLRFCFMEVTLGYLAFYYIVMLLDCYYV